MVMHLGSSIADALGADLLRARNAVMRQLEFDPAHSPHFWEAWVAQVTGGELTPHKHEGDVILEGARRYLVEVKFSQAFDIAFRNGTRRCFKWLMTLPQMQRVNKADAVVMIGLDGEDVGAWCAPAAALGRSITITAPAARLSNWSRFDRWAVPPYDLLPAVLRCCHLK